MAGDIRKQPHTVTTRWLDNDRMTPLVTRIQKRTLCRYFMPEEGLEPTAFGL
jgi:hypothetical protein